MQLSVIIVNYNVKYFLEQCLSSLLAAIETVDAEVCVVDNASIDGSVEYLKTKFPRINFIVNTTNVGFAKANNMGLEQSQGKYVLFLNPDTILPEDCLTGCLAFLEGNEQAGALGVRMIDGTGAFLPESKRSFPSPATSFYKLTGLSRLFPNSTVFGRYALTYLSNRQNHEVDVLAGAFLMARKEMLCQLKGFDEAFFMYGEDIDLSFRIQMCGYKNYYFSETTIIHFKGESAKKGSFNYVRIFYQAMSIFVKKHYTGTSARVYVFFIQAAICLRASISAAGALFHQSKKPAENLAAVVKKQQTIVVGTEEEYHKLVDWLAKAGCGLQITGRVSVDRQRENAIGLVEDLPVLIRKGGAKQVIFCSGRMTYKAIIDAVQKLPANVSVRFHARGTDSIVGSDSKNRSGVFVAGSDRGL